MNRADAESFCSAEGIELTKLYNRIALIVADRFDKGTLSYEDGDGVMNAIFGMMMDGDKPMGLWNPHGQFILRLMKANMTMAAALTLSNLLPSRRFAIS